MSASSFDMRPARRYRPGPVTSAVALTILVSAFFSADPLLDAVTGEAIELARLTRPLAYLLGAPLFGVWDSLSLLTASQHYAVVSSLVALYVLTRLRARRTGHSLVTRVAREIGRAFGALLLLLGFYAGGLLLPRPMVGLELNDPDLVSIDFHSHTAHSHDGWALFSARLNRAWHEAGGFDVGYVTDHYTWEGADEASSDNPELAGERTVLLKGAEIRIHRRPTNVLGDRSRYVFALDADSVYMEPDSLRRRPLIDGRKATLLYTMPGSLGLVVPYSAQDLSGVIGIELVDGSPRGLEQVRRERSEILALADSLDLAVIAAANLHGWGRTVAGWSVMRIPGWPALTPRGLAEVIEDTLHAERRNAVQVVERRMPYHGGRPALLAATLPWLTWEHFRMLGTAERVSWLVWAALFAAVAYRRSARLRHAELA